MLYKAVLSVRFTCKQQATEQLPIFLSMLIGYARVSMSLLLDRAATRFVILHRTGSLPNADSQPVVVPARC